MEQARTAVAAEQRSMAARLKALEAELAASRTRLAASEHEVASSKAEIERQLEGLERRLEVSERQVTTYREVLIKRSELVHSLMSGGEAVDHNDMLAATATLLDELRSGQVRNKCSVCMDQEINCVLMPCRHRAMCSTCSNAVTRCP